MGWIKKKIVFSNFLKTSNTRIKYFKNTQNNCHLKYCVVEVGSILIAIHNTDIIILTKV